MGRLMTSSVRSSLALLRHPKVWIALVGVGLGVLGIVVAFQFRPLATAELQRDAEQAEREGNLVRAALRADQFLAREPRNDSMLLLALRVAVRRQEWSAARNHLSQLVTPSGREAVESLSAAGDAFFHAGYVEPAEDCFRRVLVLAPGHQVAHTRLAFLLSCEGRRWESVPHLLELLKQGQCSIDQLLWLGNLQSVVGDDSLLKKWAAVDPDALGPRLGIAIRKLAQHDPVNAAPRLLALAVEYPEALELGIQLGKVALELSQLDNPSNEENELRRRTTEAFLQWHARSVSGGVPGSEAHPELWVVRGRWLLAQGAHRAAARCFAEAVRLNPDHPFANYQLAQLLQRAPANSAVQDCLQRAERLDELFRITSLVYDNRRHVGFLRQAAEQTEALGRLWEAWGWQRMILAIEPTNESAWQQSTKLRMRLDAEHPGRVLPTADPTAKLDLAQYPLPDWSSLKEIVRDPSRSESPSDVTAAAIRFEDMSRDVGIDFTYFNSADDETGMRSFEFTGGGVAVMDFDVDGWPDLYFTQGCPWPHRAGQRETLDRLFRNVGGRRFEEVTAFSGIVEDRFSQGATVGDFDSDGFPDLYVANIGPNRFFRNNGDGTFSDVTDPTGTAGDLWSTSCVLADFNADGLPDLYVVNYLTGDDVFTRICHEPDGSPRLCYPQVFPPAADQFYLNRGDGTFAESSDRCGVRDTTGRGLGVVAADFEGRGRLNLFVANDTTANFYFRNHTAQAGDLPAFSEEGIASGLAFDFAGRPQAGMGVAAADADRDGRLDLFVTNFEREYNNLYRQTAPGLFSDAIASSGIKDAGYPMLGFGTQFLDADLDGWPDLFVANGHIDDFTRQGIPYRMPPQFFHNRGQATFRELREAELGPYFRGRYLGRAVARLDWNRDGLDDLAVGHLGESSVLLTNRTERAGRFLALELRGTTSSRDAIGTRVDLHGGGTVMHHQLVAGDGYQASNERRLVMGTGSASRVDRILVTWPNGLVQSFADLPTNTAWLAIEGRERLIPLRNGPVADDVRRRVAEPVPSR